MAAFEEAGAAIAPIYDIAQVMSDPQYQALGSITTVDHPDRGPIKIQNFMFRMRETPGEVRHPGRRVGQDTDAVLREILGLTEDRLRSLRDKGLTTPARQPAKAKAAS